jgi:tRNA (adenine57-N1/adenine58-N1)-methyltransferase
MSEQTNKPWNSHGNTAQAGDLVELVGLRHKHFIFPLFEGGVLQTHRGVLKHDDLIGQPWGKQVFSHMGSPFFLLQPGFNDLLRELPRATQILYPKDIGYILLSMGIGAGSKVVEAGSGSGSLTCAFANAVGETGKVYSYDFRAELQAYALKNVKRLGLENRVEFKVGDIQEGFVENDADALFLDMQNPYHYIGQARAALKPGGFFGSLLPTTNQVVTLLTELRRQDFAFIDVCEIMLRFYKADPEHFRPTDRMVAHTGYLIFARPVIIDHEKDNQELLNEVAEVAGED